MNLLPLSSWFLRHKRSFPWREDPTPYRVWISEIMLQQTLAAVVIGYFERWITRFPDIAALARAKEEEVIKAWEGLGYYSRARNIHKTAQIVVEKFGGEFPHTEEDLKALPGLGPYTVGAILSFAYQQRQAAVDGNVMRVISRLFAIEEEVDTPRVQKKIRQLTQEILPLQESHIAMEALIELGATLCGKKPKCAQCPLQMSCRGHAKGIAEKLPLKKKRSQTIHLYRFVPIISCQGRYLVRQIPEGEIMQGLWEFPYMEEKGPIQKMAEMGAKLEASLGIQAQWQSDFPSVSHTFTNYRAHLAASLWEASQKVELPSYEWLTIKEMERCSFSSGHRRLLNHLLLISKYF